MSLGAEDLPLSPVGVERDLLGCLESQFKSHAPINPRAEAQALHM